MPYNVEWLMKDRIFEIHASGVVTLEEMEAYSSTIISMLEQSPYPLIHAIADDAHVESFPRLALFSKIPWLRHPKMGWLVSYGIDQPVARFVGHTAGQITRLRLRLVKDYDEAIEFLQYVDVTLPDLNQFDQSTQ